MKPALTRRLLAAALSLFAAATAQAGATLDAVKKRDALVCGVSTGVAGFSSLDEKGRWSGLDVDVCRAVAAAVLGSGEKVRFVPLNAASRFAALKAGEIDLLSRNTTWTTSRDASLGFHATAVTYYDGQAFLVPKRLKLKSPDQLKGASICVQSGTTTEKNLADYFRSRKITFKPVVFEGYEATFKAFFSGRCQAFSADASALAAVRNKEAPKPDEYEILPGVISKEPLAPLVRRGDDEWFAIVKWVIYALIDAEERGVTQANVKARQAKDADPAVQRLLGADAGEDSGQWLGLPRDWAARSIGAVGNYGEVFERNVGSQSLLKLPRGQNALWSQGGLMFAPPVR